MNPAISVIVPVYNKEPYLHRCIDSILSQTFTDFELLLIDDGSTDRSGEICDAYAGKDKRVRVFHKENGGVSSARNKGIQKANGEWIIFLDADDYFLLDALRLLLDVALKNKTKISAANFYVEKDNKRYGQCEGRDRIVKNNFRSCYFMTCYLRTGTVLFHSSVIYRFSFDESLCRYEDIKLWLEIMREQKIAYTSECVFVYSENSRCLSLPVKDISKDYIFSMSFTKKDFWEKMILASLLRQGLSLYPNYKSILRGKYKNFMHLIYLENFMSISSCLYIRFVRFIRKTSRVIKK